MDEKKLRYRIKSVLIIFIIGLIVSGLTAFPIETQLSIAVKNLNAFPVFMKAWIEKVYNAIKITNQNFPYLSYGTDWLAFAHLVIAVVFIGPIMDPIKNIWVVQFGMIACTMVIPLALIAGPIREIPFFWTLIDCSFGLFGFIPLYVCYHWIRKLEKLKTRP